MVSHILQMIIRCIWNVYLFSCLFATCESQFGRIKNQFGKVKTQFGKIKNKLGSMKNGLLSNSLLKAREFYCCLKTSSGANWLTYSHDSRGHTYDYLAILMGPPYRPLSPSLPQIWIPPWNLFRCFRWYAGQFLDVFFCFWPKGALTRT